MLHGARRYGPIRQTYLMDHVPSDRVRSAFDLAWLALNDADMRRDKK